MEDWALLFFLRCFCPGKENAVVEPLSRVSSNISSSNSLRTLHNELCQPDITRMIHLVWSWNLPYSVEIKKITTCCQICPEHKPWFYRPTPGSHSTFRKAKCDFKGPLESKTRNQYLLTIIVCIALLRYIHKLGNKMSVFLVHPFWSPSIYLFRLKNIVHVRIT